MLGIRRAVERIKSFRTGKKRGRRIPTNALELAPRGGQGTLPISMGIALSILVPEGWGVLPNTEMERQAASKATRKPS